MIGGPVKGEIKRHGRKAVRAFQVLQDEWESCTRCPLGTKAVTHVLLRGDIPADVLFIGEAPGEEEDARGRPFVGPAGRVLQAMIDDVLRLNGPFRYCITNVVACIPRAPDGHTRAPNKEEMAACSPRIVQTVLMVNPKAFVLLGKVAASVTGLPDDFEDLTINLFHPSYVMRKGGIGKPIYNKEVLRLSKFLKGIV